MSERESKTRSRALRSYVFATFATRSPEELTRFLPILVARMHYEKTPKGTIQEVVQQFLDYLEIKGVPLTPNLTSLKLKPPENVTCVIPELDTGHLSNSSFGTPEEEEDEGDGIVDLKKTFMPESPSPLLPLVTEVLELCWERSLAARFPSFLWKRVSFEGQPYYLIASWKLRSPHADATAWNLAAAYSGGIVYSADSDILVRHEDRPVHWSKDFREFPLAIPAAMTKSEFAGKTIAVTGTLFVWALHWKPGVEVRCWFNESVGGKRSATGDLLRQSHVMPHFLPVAKTG